MSVRSNTVAVKPQQLHDPPEGGRGRTRRGGGQIKRESVRASVMRTDCRSGIQSIAELNGFWETGIVQVMCFNKIRFTGASSVDAGVCTSTLSAAPTQRGRRCSHSKITRN